MSFIETIYVLIKLLNNISRPEIANLLSNIITATFSVISAILGGYFALKIKEREEKFVISEKQKEYQLKFDKLYKQYKEILDGTVGLLEEVFLNELKSIKDQKVIGNNPEYWKAVFEVSIDSVSGSIKKMESANIDDFYGEESEKLYGAIKEIKIIESLLKSKANLGISDLDHVYKSFCKVIKELRNYTEKY